MQNVTEQLREFVLERFLFGDRESMPADGESFLGKGIIDSTGVMELILFVEQQYGVKVEDEEMAPENLDSIDRLRGFISRKTGAGAESRAEYAA